MAQIDVVKCDICGSETRNSDVQWYNKATHISWNIPSDGINHGKFEGHACERCRRYIGDILNRTCKYLKDGKQEPKESSISEKIKDHPPIPPNCPYFDKDDFITPTGCYIHLNGYITKKWRKVIFIVACDYWKKAVDNINKKVCIKLWQEWVDKE